MSGYAKIVADLLKTGMELSSIFPYDNKKTRKDRPHMKDVALRQNNFVHLDANTIFFDIGNEEAEETAPHYHILEDAKIIRKPYRGTDKSRGSQRLVSDKKKRDYGLFSYRERTQTKSDLFGGLELNQEYRQNQSRNFWGNAAKAREYSERVKYHHVYKRNYFENRHYMYIERILEQLVPQIAVDIGAKLGQTSSIIELSEISNQEITTINVNGLSNALDPMTGELIIEDD